VSAERTTSDPKSLHQALAQGDAALFRAYKAGTRADDLIRMRARMVDELLRDVWLKLVGSGDGVALVAVGGYGRGELHPHSDIDLLILLADDGEQRYASRIERFLTYLWDAGLNLGHSVRTPQECAREAERDLTVATTLVETRLISGDGSMYEAMHAATGPDRIWPPRDFFEAKLKEQQARHEKFHDTAYKLEPNVKESPGGLRDIQTLLWVAKRCLGTEKSGELIDQGLLTESEFNTLKQGRRFLWQVRFLLHHSTGRCEDRLLFDLQRDLAHAFGYLDDTRNMAIEQFMQRYYRTVMRLQRLNEVLLQSLKESLLHEYDAAQAQPVNERFVVRKGFLDVAHDKVFEESPPALLEVFLLLAQHADIEDVRASTIRLIRDHLHLIDGKFRADNTARRLFMDILRQPQGITHNLRRMNRYGVLAAYLPAFERIVGRMQYDLFHIYTVDEHTLFVIRNLRRMSIAEHQAELPLCSQVFTTIDKPEVLYIAGMFHDIAKGRGGDHSELGAIDVREFSELHGLDAHDVRLAEWLVARHLLMSVTAQRKDLSDPTVIHTFASEVSSIDMLNHLFLLTVADIRATNPELWNSWKDNLLQDLYHKTVHALQRGLDNPIDAEDRLREIKRAATQLLEDAGVSMSEAHNIWADFGDGYFLRHSADEVAWHTQVIMSRHVVGEPLVAIRQETQRGSTEIFVFVADHDNLFALVTAVLDRLGTDIVDARIVTSESGWAVDTFLILENSGETISDGLRVHEIQDALQHALRNPDDLPSVVMRRPPRRLRHFDVPLEIRRTDEQRGDVTPLEIIAPDAPGLLAKIGRAFVQCELRVHNARVMTIGERAQDVFFVSDKHNRPLGDPTLRRLRDAIDAQLTGGT
jgi:[protein-PII] uridylyltransferase